MTADKAGNPGVEALSTSMLVQLVENAAIHCLEPTLEAGEVSLGTHVDLEHHKPVPVGFILRIEVEVVMVDGPRISFAVQAFDEQEPKFAGGASAAMPDACAIALVPMLPCDAEVVGAATALSPRPAVISMARTPVLSRFNVSS